MEIKAFCIFDAETIKRFVLFSFTKNIPVKFRSIIKWLLPLLLLVIMGSFVFWVKSKEDLLYYSIFCLCIISSYLFVVYIIPHKKIQVNMKYVGIENQFIFKEDSFEVTSSSLEFQGKSTVKYNKIKGIYQDDSYIYIYLAGASAYIVQKSSFGDNISQFKQHMNYLFSKNICRI